MKKYIFILLVAPIFCHSQSDTLHANGHWSIFMEQSSFPNVEFWISMKSDSSFQISNNPSDLTIEGDTACAIIFLLKQQRRANQLLESAEEILAYTKTDGSVSNYRKWDKAVKKYMKLKKDFSRYLMEGF